MQVQVVYASQTGTAEEVAGQIHRMALNRNLNASVNNISDKDWLHNSFLSTNHTDTKVVYVFVVSTTGDGLVPDSMQAFWNFLLQKKLPAALLETVEFAVFGLGDSSYAKFNAVARRLQARLKQLGASEFIPRGLGDDQHEIGYFGSLDPWTKDLFNAALAHSPLPQDFVIDDSPKLEELPYKVSTSKENTVPGENPGTFYAPPLGAYNADNSITPMDATLIVNERITAADWEQDVRHIELELPEALNYVPGDIVWMYPQNVGLDIKSFVKDTMKYDPDCIITVEDPSHKFPTRCSILSLFTSFLDILGTPRRYFFEQLSLFATNEEEVEKLQEMASASGADLLHDYCKREKRTFVEVFTDFKSLEIPIERIFDLVPTLAPRAFSISSASSRNPKIVHMTVAIVDFLTPYKRRRFGVCTSWLCTLTAESKVKVWIGKGLLSLPKTRQKLILIGPGTGVAPLRSIIQDLEGRSTTNTSTDIALFFGCRHEKKDFLYESEFRKYESHKLLTLHTAFSRDQDYKIYVQGRLAEQREMIYKWLTEEGAYVYVAGSAKRMPTDVYETIRDILRSVGKLPLKEADLFMKRLVAKKRYNVESWS